MGEPKKARPQLMDLRKLRDSENPKVRELAAKLAEGVESALAGPGRLAEFLRFMAKFRKYSPGNIALIHSQKPDASLVAGIKTWNELGRRVKRGEKGIAIFAPTVRKVLVRLEETDPETGETRIVEREEERLVGFHITHVFDVSQTEGRPLPEPPAEREVAGGDAARFIWERLLSASPFPVGWGCSVPDAKGEFIPATGEIRLDPTLGEGMRAKVLLHEVAHGLAWRLGVDGRKFQEELGARQAYTRGEAIAEGAAFIAAAHFGLDTADYSYQYIAMWLWNAGAQHLLDWLEDIQKVANELIALVESAGGRRAAA